MSQVSLREACTLDSHGALLKLDAAVNAIASREALQNGPAELVAGYPDFAWTVDAEYPSKDPYGYVEPAFVVRRRTVAQPSEAGDPVVTSQVTTNKSNMDFPEVLGRIDSDLRWLEGVGGQGTFLREVSRTIDISETDLGEQLGAHTLGIGVFLGVHYKRSRIYQAELELQSGDGVSVGHFDLYHRRKSDGACIGQRLGSGVFVISEAGKPAGLIPVEMDTLVGLLYPERDPESLRALGSMILAHVTE